VRTSSPLLKPRWLVGHVLVVLITIGFTLLGVWQLGRHFQQQDDNRVLESKLAEPPIGVAELDDSDVESRTAVVSGEYDYQRQLELRPRARNGQVGYDQIVPLRTDGAVVLVNRGFIPDAAGSARQQPPPTVAVTVTGTVRLSRAPSSLGPQNPATGILDTIARVDIDRLNPQFDNVLAPVYLDLISEAPNAGGISTVMPEPPEPTSRPNLPYAVQWWAFAGVVSVGWFLYLRKQFFTR